jgi:hypothetical protein
MWHGKHHVMSGPAEHGTLHNTGDILYQWFWQTC